jgi:hypothetical protein
LEGEGRQARWAEQKGQSNACMDACMPEWMKEFLIHETYICVCPCLLSTPGWRLLRSPSKQIASDAAHSLRPCNLSRGDGWVGAANPLALAGLWVGPDQSQITSTVLPASRSVARLSGGDQQGNRTRAAVVSLLPALHNQVAAPKRHVGMLRTSS